MGSVSVRVYRLYKLTYRRTTGSVPEETSHGHSIRDLMFLDKLGSSALLRGWIPLVSVERWVSLLPHKVTISVSVLPPGTRREVYLLSVHFL